MFLDVEMAIRQGIKSRFGHDGHKGYLLFSKKVFQNEGIKCFQISECKVLKGGKCFINV